MRGGRWTGEERGARAREVEGGPQEELPWRGDGIFSDGLEET